MFSILENIYSGWQYFISFFCNFSENFPAFLDILSRSSNALSSFFNDFSFPDWFSNTIFLILGISFICKFFHWR